MIVTFEIVVPKLEVSDVRVLELPAEVPGLGVEGDRVGLTLRVPACALALSATEAVPFPSSTSSEALFAPVLDGWTWTATEQESPSLRFAPGQLLLKVENWEASVPLSETDDTLTGEPSLLVNVNVCEGDGP